LTDSGTLAPATAALVADILVKYPAERLAQLDIKRGTVTDEKGQPRPGMTEPNGRGWAITFADGLAGRNPKADPDTKDFAVALEEVSHFGYDAVLTPGQRAAVERIYKEAKADRATRQALNKTGLADTKEGIAYGWSNEAEFFARQFVEYILAGKAPVDPSLVQVFKDFAKRVADAIARLAGRGSREQAVFKKLEPYLRAVATGQPVPEIDGAGWKKAFTIRSLIRAAIEDTRDIRTSAEADIANFERVQGQEFGTNYALNKKGRMPGELANANVSDRKTMGRRKATGSLSAADSIAAIGEDAFLDIIRKAGSSEIRQALEAAQDDGSVSGRAALARLILEEYAQRDNENRLPSPKNAQPMHPDSLPDGSRLTILGIPGRITVEAASTYFQTETTKADPNADPFAGEAGTIKTDGPRVLVSMWDVLPVENYEPGTGTTAGAQRNAFADQMARGQPEGIDPAFGRSSNAPATVPEDLPTHIEVNGVRRPTTTSTGKQIHPTAEGVKAFWRWFKDSKAVDDQGRPIVMYHGTRRPDRIGNQFRKTRATSGPMSFFTDDPALASSYATNKQDTSLEPPSDYAEWFQYKPAGSRATVDIDRAWFMLSPQERAIITEKLPHVTSIDPDGNESSTYRLGGPKEYGMSGGDRWAYEIRQARGNVLKAAKEIWLSSGALFDSERDFIRVLELGGMDTSKVAYADPNATYPAVLPVHLSIQNPFATSPENVAAIMDDFQRSANRQRSVQNWGADQWDKRNVSASEWMGRLREDVQNNTAHAWTSIPDWVTKVLASKGYDGIKDLGGKSGGVEHNVWIPFDDGQVKSATGNRGTFDPSSKKLNFSREAPGQLGLFHGRDVGPQGGRQGSLFDTSPAPKPPDGTAPNATAPQREGESAADYRLRLKSAEAEKATGRLFARAMPETIDVDGTQRPTVNSDGKPIHPTEDGIRAFWRWFGDSKVVDGQGRPRVVYHGTPDGRFLQQEAVFKSPKQRYGMGGDGAFWFASDPATAASYADDRRAFDYQNAEPKTIAAYIRLTNPTIVEAAGKEWRDAQQVGKTSDVIDQAKAAGSDGVLIRNVKDNYNNTKSTRATTTFTVFDSTQIKSATGNQGTFIADNPDIRFARPTGDKPETSKTAQQINRATGVTTPKSEKVTTTERAGLKKQLAQQAKVAAEAFKAGKMSQEERAAKIESVRQRVERITGQGNQPDAARMLRKALKQQVKASVEGYRQGKREATAKAKAELIEIRAAIDDKAKRTAQTARTVKKALIGVITRNIKPADRGRFLSAVAKAKTFADLIRAQKSVQTVMLKRTGKLARARVLSMTSKGEMKRLTQDRRNQIRAILDGAQADMDRFKRAAPGTRQRFSDKQLAEAALRIEQAEQAIGAIIAEHKAETARINGGRGMTLAAAKAQAIGNIEKQPDRKLDKNGLPADLSAAEKARALLNSTDNMAETVGKIEGVPAAESALHAVMVDDLRRGESAKLARMRELREAMDAAARTAGYEGLVDAQVADGLLGEALTQRATVTLGGKTIRMTVADLMDLHASATDPSTRAHLAKGTPIVLKTPNTAAGNMYPTLAEIEAATDNLTPEQRKAAQMLKKVVESTRPEVFTAFRRLKGYEPEAMPEYWPRQRDMEQSGRQVETLEGFNPSNVLFKIAEDAGFTEARGNDFRTPIVIRSIWGRTEQHLDGAMQLAHMAEPLRNAISIAKDPLIVQAIAKKHGPKAHPRMKTMLAAFTGAENTETPIGKVVSWLNSARAKALLSLNPNTMLLQQAGITRMLDRYTAEEMAAAAPDAAKITIQEMSEVSGYFDHRYNGDPALRMVGMVEGGGKSAGFKRAMGAVWANLKQWEGRDAWNALQRAFSAVNLLSKAESNVAKVALAVERRRAKAAGLTGQAAERAAVLAAEAAIRDTQNASSTLDQSYANIKTRRTGGAAFTLFTSDTQTQLSRIKRARRDGGNAGMVRAIASELPSIMAATGLRIAGVGPVVGLIAAGLSGNDDEFDRRWRAMTDPSNWAKAAGANVAGLILPLGGQAAVDIARKTADGKGSTRFDASTDTPSATIDFVLGSAGRIQQAAEAIGNNIRDPNAKTTAAAAKAAGAAVYDTLLPGIGFPGMPILNIGRQGIRGATDTPGEKPADRSRLLDEAAAAGSPEAAGRVLVPLVRGKNAKERGEVLDGLIRRGPGKDAPAAERGAWRRQQLDAIREAVKRAKATAGQP